MLGIERGSTTWLALCGQLTSAEAMALNVRLCNTPPTEAIKTRLVSARSACAACGRHTPTSVCRVSQAQLNLITFVSSLCTGFIYRVLLAISSP